MSSKQSDGSRLTISPGVPFTAADYAAAAGMPIEFAEAILAQALADGTIAETA